MPAYAVASLPTPNPIQVAMATFGGSQWRTAAISDAERERAAARLKAKAQAYLDELPGGTVAEPDTRLPPLPMGRTMVFAEDGPINVTAATRLQKMVFESQVQSAQLSSMIDHDPMQMTRKQKALYRCAAHEMVQTYGPDGRLSSWC